jgi:transposase
MMPDHALEVIPGVDTHQDEHVCVLVDLLGRRLASRAFPATLEGYHALLGWASQHGHIRRAGVEGTGSYGAGLARYLADHGVTVIEVTRPNRRDRRHVGKTDTRDAEAAAVSVLTGLASGHAKTRDGIVEAIRVLQLTRASAVKSRTQAHMQLRMLIISAPAHLREQLDQLPARRRVDACARLRRDTGHPAVDATAKAIRTLARRQKQLDAEIRDLDRDLAALVTKAAPRLLAQPGVGIETAAKLLIVAGDNPRRITTHAALAALCGASPVEASSGKTRRHRLNRGGDRQGNNALWTIATNRMIHHAETRAYVDRRTAEGLSKKEIRRCIMRHLARRLHPLLIADLTDANLT